MDKLNENDINEEPCAKVEDYIKIDAGDDSDKEVSFTQYDANTGKKIGYFSAMDCACDEKTPRWTPDSNKDSGTKSRNTKPFWISAVAVLSALLIAAVAIICVGFTREPEPTLSTSSSQVSAMSLNAPAAMLNLTDTSSMVSRASSEEGGYVLTDVSEVVQEVLPSVVSVTSRTLVNYFGSYGGNYGGDFNDIWDFFFGDSKSGRGGAIPMPGNDGSQSQEEPQTEEGDNDDETGNDETAQPEEMDYGMGSGTIIAQNSTELLVLTSYHVVEDSSSLYVTFTNGTSVDGYIKSADMEKDIAIVAIPLEDIDDETMDTIKIATISDEPAKVGEGVIVIGNALGYGISVTTGIVSAVDREITVEGRTLNVIQTDAAINSGNSGGCMLNSKGEVIGINEAKVTISYVEGMCYAIPVESNLDLIQSLLNEEQPFEEVLEEKKNEEERRAYGGFLGIRGRDVDSSIKDLLGNDYPQGVYVSSVVPGSAAEEAQIKSGDIITGINDTVITTMDELSTQLRNYSGGDEVTLVVLREVDGTYSSMVIDVTLTDWIN